MARTNKSTAAVVEVSAPVEVKAVYPTTEEMITAGLTTKSARIRHLHSLGMPKGDIARQETNGLYQHVYNVIKKPLKKTPAESTVTPEPIGDEEQSSQEEAPANDEA